MRSIQLTPGERVLRDSGVSAWNYAFNLVGLLVCAAILAFLLGALRSLVHDGGVPFIISGRARATVDLVLDNRGLLVSAVLAVGMVRVLSTARSRRYILTDLRLVVASGTVYRGQRTIDLDRIDEVSAYQTFAGRLLGYGDLVVRTADSREPILVRYVDAPHDWFVAITKSAETSVWRHTASRTRAASSVG